MEESVTIEKIIAKIKKNNWRADTKRIVKAYNFAKDQHGDQLRKSGESYIIHPLEVANILVDIGLDEDSICAALLHDVVEDTNVTTEDIIREFGPAVGELVAGLTKLSMLRYSTIEETQVENYRKMFLAMGKDIRVILIKLADRLHNMRTLNFLERDRQIANAKETMEIYSPLANRLGIYSLKWELEDLSFKYLKPDEYREIITEINQKKETRLHFLDQITAQIKVDLKKEKIDAEISGRAKHLHSIYRKMQLKNLTLDEVYDLFALRIFVNSVKDCYAALGIVHKIFNPIPGRFKDYISVPKPNMYQSLHTTLIGPGGIPFEVQIRTWDMHRIAEFGIAAHWAYKEAGKSIKATEDKLAWLRESLEWQKEMEDPDDFLNTLKTELFEDEVYVFTPRGEIKVLPRGSTPIDFAYSIHEQIGHKMTGAKINSKMIPIITHLHNGDIVEVITSDSPKGPSRDWLKFVKSSTAKSKIQSWFKKANREENIIKGKEALEREVKKLGLVYAELFKQEWIPIVLDRYKYNTLDDMYASIGYGAISPLKIIYRLIEEYRKVNKETELEEKLEQLKKAKPQKVRTSKSGIVVKGIDNCLVKLSKCCNPLPGDDIIGYITKGRGVSVHRADCINVQDLVSSGENRLLDVYWEDDLNTSYNADIAIYSNDRSNLLSDIIKEISKTKAELIVVNSKVVKERIVVTEITLRVENTEELNNILKAIRKIDSVYEVSRKK